MIFDCVVLAGRERKHSNSDTGKSGDGELDGD